MSLLLPGKVLRLNALLAMTKFRNCGNKAGAVKGFEELQEIGLGKIHFQKDCGMVSTIMNNMLWIFCVQECMHERWVKENYYHLCSNITQYLNKLQFVEFYRKSNLAQVHSIIFM